jgi:hypothetical protein
MLVWQHLRMRVHRIGLSHWHAQGHLRSWGVAPLHRRDQQLWVPCGDAEAVWLGLWLDNDAGTEASATLNDPADMACAHIALPTQFQFTGLTGADQRCRPLSLAPDGAPRPLHLTLSTGDAQAELTLVLHPPLDWAQASGLPAPAALRGPPPLPPRYP